MTTFVLIPGAGGAAWYWHLVAPKLERAGHEAFAVDIPEDDPVLGLPEYADIVEEAIGDREDVVLVAQSMGAFTAAMVAGQRPVRLVGLVNAMVPLPGETPGQWWDITGQPEAMRLADERAGRRGGFDEGIHFLHDVPEEVLEGATEPRVPADTPFGQPCEFDGWSGFSVRSLIGTGDRFFPPSFQRALARNRLGIEPDEIPGGHLIALSNPRGVAQWLLEASATSPHPDDSPT
ncbi:alpha/beta fold hydrolase [Tessaracoccus antarcticus]|uniref:Alpha/beta hydrolase n=1 Tax=Tessaracoccus antarcticus TaxID=2479848 RepID=A0A3M0GAJ4_9ACTN|nr:alpha/beta hydrolase [Tessaracoccus antarcticus]RMB61924.1 alpha/beta hydrolase [Tessaracoccus antarcticus]